MGFLQSLFSRGTPESRGYRDAPRSAACGNNPLGSLETAKDLVDEFGVEGAIFSMKRLLASGATEQRMGQTIHIERLRNNGKELEFENKKTLLDTVNPQKEFAPGYERLDAVIIEQYKRIQDAFVLNPSTTIQMLPSPAHLYGSDRSIVAIFERDPHDPSIINEYWTNAPADPADFQKFLAAFTDTIPKEIVLKNGKISFDTISMDRPPEGVLEKYLRSASDLYSADQLAHNTNAREWLEDVAKAAGDPDYFHKQRKLEEHYEKILRAALEENPHADIKQIIGRVAFEEARKLDAGIVPDIDFSKPVQVSHSAEKTLTTEHVSDQFSHTDRKIFDNARQGQEFPITEYLHATEKGRDTVTQHSLPPQDPQQLRFMQQQAAGVPFVSSAHSTTTFTQLFESKEVHLPDRIRDAERAITDQIARGLELHQATQAMRSREIHLEANRAHGSETLFTSRDSTQKVPSEASKLPSTKDLSLRAQDRPSSGASHLRLHTPHTGPVHEKPVTVTLVRSFRIEPIAENTRHQGQNPVVLNTREALTLNDGQHRIMQRRVAAALEDALRAIPRSATPARIEHLRTAGIKDRVVAHSSVPDRNITQRETAQLITKIPPLLSIQATLRNNIAVLNSRVDTISLRVEALKVRLEQPQAEKRSLQEPLKDTRLSSSIRLEEVLQRKIHTMAIFTKQEGIDNKGLKDLVLLRNVQISPQVQTELRLQHRMIRELLVLNLKDQANTDQKNPDRTAPLSPAQIKMIEKALEQYALMIANTRNLPPERALLMQARALHDVLLKLAQINGQKIPSNSLHIFLLKEYERLLLQLTVAGLTDEFSPSELDWMLSLVEHRRQRTKREMRLISTIKDPKVVAEELAKRRAALSALDTAQENLMRKLKGSDESHVSRPKAVKQVSTRPAPGYELFAEQTGQAANADDGTDSSEAAVEVESAA